MFVIIMSAEHSRRIDLVECINILIFMKMNTWMDLRGTRSIGKNSVHHIKVVGALRVSPAVTRLTVDRRHQVPVLPESNTGEGDIGQPPHPYKCVGGLPLIDLRSVSFYRNELSRRQGRAMIMRFDFL